MVDCQEALKEAAGDLEKAVEILRKKGIARAAKRSEKEAGEGIITAAAGGEGREGYILEMRAETDFVVRGEKFQELALKIMETAMNKKISSLEELLEADISGEKVKSLMESLSGVLGEKLEIKRYDFLKSEGTVAAYNHHGGRLAVLVSLDKAGAASLAMEVAMQIAAANPRYLSPAEIPAAELEKEKEIYREQLAREGKGAEIIEKILFGKINKYFEEVCLLNQEFIKDEAKKVKDVLGDVKVEKFIRYSL